VIIIALFVIEPFLSWWINPQFGMSSGTIAEIILVGAWFSGLAFIPHDRLQAEGRPSVVTKCYIVELVPYLLIMVLSINLFGAIGAAIAWALRTCIDLFLMFNLAKGWPKDRVPFYVCTLLVFVSFVTVLLSEGDSMVRQIVIVLIVPFTVWYSWIKVPSVVKHVVLPRLLSLGRANG
jgi:O-antigen/teichoic acid export membrane protein